MKDEIAQISLRMKQKGTPDTLAEDDEAPGEEDQDHQKKEIEELDKKIAKMKRELEELERRKAQILQRVKRAASPERESSRKDAEETKKGEPMPPKRAKPNCEEGEASPMEPGKKESSVLLDQVAASGPGYYTMPRFNKKLRLDNHPDKISPEDLRDRQMRPFHFLNYALPLKEKKLPSCCRFPKVGRI